MSKPISILVVGDLREGSRLGLRMAAIQAQLLARGVEVELVAHSEGAQREPAMRVWVDEVARIRQEGWDALARAIESSKAARECPPSARHALGRRTAAPAPPERT